MTLNILWWVAFFVFGLALQHIDLQSNVERSYTSCISYY